jgi:hypothetical protein
MSKLQLVKIIIFSLISICEGIVFSGCSTAYQDYSGPTPPPEQTSILKLTFPDGPGGGLLGIQYYWVSAIDEKTIFRPHPVIKLLPGKHTISFQLNLSGIISVAPMHIDVTFEAGKTYIALPRINENHQWSVEIKQEQ